MEKIMDTKKNEMHSELPYAALDEVPSPKSDAKEIVGLVKSSGRISGYQLSDGSTVSKEEGVSMAIKKFCENLLSHRTFYYSFNFSYLITTNVIPLSYKIRILSFFLFWKSELLFSKCNTLHKKAHVMRKRSHRLHTF